MITQIYIKTKNDTGGTDTVTLNSEEGITICSYSDKTIGIVTYHFLLTILQEDIEELLINGRKYNPLEIEGLFK